MFPEFQLKESIFASDGWNLIILNELPSSFIAVLWIFRYLIHLIYFLFAEKKLNKSKKTYNSQDDGKFKTGAREISSSMFAFIKNIPWYVEVAPVS